MDSYHFSNETHIQRSIKGTISLQQLESHLCHEGTMETCHNEQLSAATPAYAIIASSATHAIGDVSARVRHPPAG